MVIIQGEWGENFDLLGENICSQPDFDKEANFGQISQISYHAHPRYQKMFSTIKMDYFWPKMRKDIIEYFIKCMECQNVKA